MGEWRSDEGGEAAETIVVKPGAARARRIAAIAGLSFLLLLLVVVAGVWTARRPIASSILEREFNQREVQATYQLDRVGLRTQQVRNLVIGDPDNPDLTARFAQIQVRIKWNGAVEVYRVVARGVRLRGRLAGGRVTWGEVSKLLPPPSDKPFEFPNMVLDLADASISLATPFGPLGFAVEGSGNMTGGFRGKVAASSPRLIPGRCQLADMNAFLAIEIVARRPHVIGPVRAQQFACPGSRFNISQALFNVDTRFSESFTDFEGSGRMAMQRVVAGNNGLANLAGNISFAGTPKAMTGSVNLASQQSRMGPVFAERTRIGGRYLLGAAAGTFTLVGEYDAEGATLAPSVLANVTGPLAAARNTPVGPIATAIGSAVGAMARNFQASGDITVVNFPGGGAARVQDSAIQAASGARVRLSGGDGVSYYWPAGRLRIDGNIQTQGGGLPTGRIALDQPRRGGPMSGVAEFAPYQAGDSRLAMAPIRFTAAADGSTEVNTLVQLDGSFPEGEVRGLRMPINARLRSGGGLSFGQRCVIAQWSYFRMRSIQLDAARLPVCPVGPAIITQSPGGPMRIAAQLNRPSLTGRLGKSPLAIQAATARIIDRDFALRSAAARLGDPDKPIRIEADRFNGTFEGRGISGNFAGGAAIIGTIPAAISEADGRWRMQSGDISVNSAATITDRNPEPRFYPMRSNNLAFTMSGEGDVRTTGTLIHPGSGTRVAEVAIRHDLGNGVGNALLDVPGITFGNSLQPEELTRLTEGVIALVSGTVTGQGRIAWSGGGNVKSSGEFSTAGMDLAAPFGPVAGLTTTVRFDDLLGLSTAPGQVATIESINPGILVENGLIRYQLLPDRRVKV